MRQGRLHTATRTLRAIVLVGTACALGALTFALSTRTAAEQTSAKPMPLGLPPYPAANGDAAERIDLGKKLFFDRRLSVNNTLSCGMCHIESQAFASTQTSLSVGMEGRSLRRNAPSLFNVAYQHTLFHDGRETDLANQVWLPLLLSDEMANPSVGSVINRIRALPDYEGAFEKVFGGSGPSMQTIGDAIAAYERTLFSANSRFDRWHYGKDANALSEEEKRGFELFTGKAQCSVCHTIENNSALFTDHKFHNTGIGYKATQELGDKRWRVQLAPGVFTTVHEDETRSYSEQRRNDLGRFEVTLKSEDRWAYKTPSLRNVALTPPYMHDGSLFTLEDVIEHYDNGGIANENLSPEIVPLGLSAEEKAALVAFLKSLDGDNAIATPISAPIGAPASTPGG